MCAKHTPDNDLQPRDLRRRIDRRNPPDEDLERALVGVQRIVLAERELARDPQQRPLVAPDDRGHAGVRIVDSLHPSGLHVPGLPASSLRAEQVGASLPACSWLI
jgi:hypothetical protein